MRAAVSLSVVLVLAIPWVAQGQEVRVDSTLEARTSVSLDAHTITTPFSLDYQRLSINLGHRIRPSLNVEIGVSVYQLDLEFCQVSDECTVSYVQVPVAVSWLSDPYGDHHFEAGAGVSVGFSDRPEPRDGLFWRAPFRLGWRYQPGAGGLSVRVFWTPTIFERFIFDPVGFSVGIGFAF